MALEINQPLLSYEDYMRLPDEPRGEVFYGVFVMTPAPRTRHQLLIGELYLELGMWLRAHPEAGKVLLSPTDVVLDGGKKATIVQPDLLFVSAAHLGIIQDNIKGAPDLAIEVVSPNSAGHDAITKRDIYAKFGVPEYWLVWPDEARIDALRDGHPDQTFRTGDTLQSPQLEGFSLDVSALFATIGTDDTP